ncbi:Ig domain-containing protein [Microbacterium sp. 3J1]|uniref:Ig domain-containing protein n=1 Tax=Microbacterium sp. 3J1 TaxID=861269 RepID=UPI000AAB8049|nr:Ig domain-containing protein [Microbacterium sp. 3J1]
MIKKTGPLLALLTAGALAMSLALPAAAASAQTMPRVTVSSSWSTHIQNIGWRSTSQTTDLVSGSNKLTFSVGTEGQSLRLEYIDPSSVQIRSDIPKVIGDANCSINLQGHVQNVGWQAVSGSAGTTGRGLRLEAIKMWSTCTAVKVRYTVHVQSIGWMDVKTAGQVAGTTGRGLAIEAVRVTLELPNLNYVYDAVLNGDCQLAGTC